MNRNSRCGVVAKNGLIGVENFHHRSEAVGV
jgi:hypothetical protein